jgi:integrase
MPATPPAVEREALTTDQAKSVSLTAGACDRLEALFVTALMLGLRPGELKGVRWDDIDLGAGTLNVTSSMKSPARRPGLGRAGARVYNRGRRADQSAPAASRRSSGDIARWCR